MVIAIMLKKIGKKTKDLMKAFLTILCVLTLVSFSLQGQEFIVSPSEIEVTAGEKFQLTYSLKGATLSNSQFRGPNLKDFKIMSGPSESTNVQMINGRVTQSSSVYYGLAAAKVGVITIPPATVKVGGKQLKTKAVKVKVKAGANQASGPSLSDLKPKDENIFIELKVDKTEIYQGEQISANYQLYTAYNISDFNLTAVPSFNGFWNDSNEPQGPQSNNQIIGDKIYQSFLIRRYALFPQNTGELVVDPIELQAYVGNRGRQKVKIKSNEVKVKVKPLPEEGKPDDFYGLVGRYNISGALDTKSAKRGEAIIYKIIISGQGNLQLIKEPTLELTEELEKYDPKITENFYPSGGKKKGSKSFEYAIIPNKEGSYEIPAIELSYFDLPTKKYRTVRTRPSKFAVSKGNGATPFVVDETQEIAGGFRDNMTAPPSLRTKSNSTFYGSIPFWLLLALPFVIFPIYFQKHQKEQALKADVLGNKRREALKLAQKRLSNAKVHMDKKEKRSFYDEIIKSLWGYLSDKVNIPIGDLSKENIDQIVAEKGVSDTTRKKLIDTIRYCEMALFAPVPDADNLEGTYDDTLELIANMEDELNLEA